MGISGLQENPRKSEVTPFNQEHLQHSEWHRSWYCVEKIQKSVTQNWKVMHQSQILNVKLFQDYLNKFIFLSRYTH